MLQILYPGGLGLYPAVSVRFTLELCVATEMRKKITKTSHFGGSQTFKIIDVDTLGKLISSACYTISNIPFLRKTSQ